jgi:transcriptional regulator with GAF, ATPase, and Fis domain
MISKTPLLISRATADPRTKDFQSIIHHNIQSVAAIPLSKKGRLLGVLYMDHHTIPAIFDENDVGVFQALGDMILTILLSSQKFSSMFRVSEITSERVRKRGEATEFFTLSPLLKTMLRDLETAARSDIPILITGESGTGKEILARLIHENSIRSKEPFIVVNSAALAPTLVESELFGIAKGIASGVISRIGKIAAADRGTLFLDEIGDMPVELQAKLLRVLETNRLEKVGSNKSEYVDFRLVCATNRNLHELQEKGQFRTDLYYRIGKYVVTLPPLRDRIDEIPSLIDYFLSYQPQEVRPAFSNRVMDAFMTYNWPGNVRELKNLVERCSILYAGKTVDIENLPPEFSAKNTAIKTSPSSSKVLQKSNLISVLELYQGNVSKAARALNIPLSSFRRILARMGLTKQFKSKDTRPNG